LLLLYLPHRAVFHILAFDLRPLLAVQLVNVFEPVHLARGLREHGF